MKLETLIAAFILQVANARIPSAPSDFFEEDEAFWERELGSKSMSAVLGQEPFNIDVDGGQCAGKSSACDAAGWVYCQDAQCGAPMVKHGVLVSECECWQPTNGKFSSLPAENAGASCVLNAQNPSLDLPQTGEAMCEAIKGGALFSTYGPEGWKPPLVVQECPARTMWAWCWGAPCESRDGNIICDCPMMISDNDNTQYISLSQYACDVETDPCRWVHNSSPNGATDIQKDLPKCKPNYENGNNYVPLPHAYKLKKGTCSKDSFTGGGDECFAPWVYCTDANCDQNLVESKYTPGVLAARCHCWMPKNTNFSIIPKETAGAGCVADQVTPGKAPFGVTGGKAMCDKMKAGKLISTYGPTGKSDIGIKIHAKAVKCKARTEWAWCWGAPCMEDEYGLITCECPIVISDWNEPQYVSVSDVACDVEKGLDEGPCSVIHNGSPAGESPMKNMPQCK